jgi:hypothetical protein
VNGFEVFLLISMAFLLGTIAGLMIGEILLAEKKLKGDMHERHK